MALQLITTNRNGGSFNVVVQGVSPDEAGGSDARVFAQRVAGDSLGTASPVCIDMMPQPIPVDQNGSPIGAGMQPFAYQATFRYTN